ncbi:MAG: AbrB/MazE/SpoVT family DNA-binding domain-containing protein [Acutalibacteraceae bacterium]|nr:AbrB/MazE/SpoVT family DNA-binding domain-containing protein [Acutalibacteraceae bacterium]
MIKNEKKNNRMGQVCTIDNLGRIVIPALMRKSYNMEKNESVELIMLEEGILMRKYQPGCIFCGNITDVTMFKEHMICQDCMKEMADKLK